MSAAEDIITKALVEIPGTRDWYSGSHRKVARKILADVAEAGGVITFDAEPTVVVPTAEDMAMRRLVAMDRADRPLN